MQQDMIIKIVGVDVVVVMVAVTDTDVVVDMDMVVVEEIMVFNSRTQEIFIRGKKGEIKIKAKLMKQKMHAIVVVEDLIGHATVAHQDILLISIKNHLRRRTKRWRQTLQVVVVIIFLMIIYLVRQILENMTTTPQLILMFLISSSKNK